MRVQVRVARAAANTSTGNQTISTSDLNGETPQAALLIIGRAVTDGTVYDGNAYAYGITDGTNEYYVARMDRDNVGTSATHKFSDNSALLGLPDWTTSTYGFSLECKASFVSFQANGITINWSNAPSAAHPITVVFFAGFDDVHCDDITIAELENNSVSTTDPGFEPDMLIGIGDRASGYEPGGTSHGDVSIGFACNKSPIEQAYCYDFSQNNQSTSVCLGQIGSQYIGMHGWTYPLARYEITSFDANGFTVTTRERDALSDDVHLNYLAFKLPAGSKVDLWCGDIDIPTSTGVQSYSDPGFYPQCVIQLCTMHTSFGSYDANGAVGCIGVMTENAQTVLSRFSDNGQSTTDTKSYGNDDRSVHVIDQSGTQIDGDLDSFNSDGWNIDYSTVDGTTRKGIALAIGRDVSPNLMPFFEAMQ